MQIVEGATEVNTGDGDDFGQITGQYATVNTGAGKDEVYLWQGGYNNVNLGDDYNYMLIQGTPELSSDNSYYSASHYNNTILGGTGNDTLTNSAQKLYVDGDGKFYEAQYVKENTDGSLYVEAENNTIITVREKKFYQYNNNYRVDLSDGNNMVDLSYTYDSDIKTGAGDDIIGIDWAENTNIDVDDGANDILFGGKATTVNTGVGNDTVQTQYSNSVQNLIKLGAGNDSIIIGGTNNTVFGGVGDDTIAQYSNNAGGNFFAYNAEFGNDVINNFKSRDKILIAQNFTTAVEDQQINYSDGTTGTWKIVTVTNNNDNSQVGTITIKNFDTFDAATNIVANLKAETTSTVNEIDVQENNQTVTLTDGADIIYVKAVAVTNLTLNDTFGADDKIVVYWEDKTTVLNEFIFNLGYGVGYHSDGQTISYNTTADSVETLLEINGLNVNEEYISSGRFIENHDHKSINLSSKYVVGATVTISNNDGSYLVYLRENWSGKTLNYVVTGDANIYFALFTGNLNLIDANGNMLPYTQQIDGQNVVLNVDGKIITLQDATIDGTQLNINVGAGQLDDLSLNKDDNGNYLIQFVNDLKTLATYVNAGNTYEGLTFKLTNNLDVSEVTAMTNFAGNFDGGDHLLSNVSADIFGTGGTVKNLYYRGTGTINAARNFIQSICRPNTLLPVRLSNLTARLTIRAARLTTTGRLSIAT